MNAYEQIEKKNIEEIGGEGTVYIHRKSGAKVITLSNDDENKTFLVSFHTPDSNSKGIPHILEHSVLCGSEKYPLKDPFVTLMKGSMYTFLNAMTFPDKTVYPVSSCNDKDFKKLTRVYLDAVLHPLLLKKKEIFLQEGWRYTKDEETGEYGYNGVVFSEMSGNMSSPDFWLETAMMKALYPDTGYANINGGIPDAIADLSYEELTDFYRSHYHPSNSVIVLYGNMDMQEYLDLIDKEYLSDFDKITPDNASLVQPDFSAPVKYSAEYPANGSGDPDKSAYLALSARLSEKHDLVSYLTVQILDELLISSPAAILKKALFDAGVGESVFGQVFYELCQPSYSICVQNADAGKADEFERVCSDVFNKLAADGIDKKALEAAITKIEFMNREEDFGRTPRGLMYAFNLSLRFNYGEDDPFSMLMWKSAFEQIKKQAADGYFEKKIREWFIDNNNRAYTVMKESEDMLDSYNAELDKKLKTRSAAFTDADKARIEEETRLLDKYRLSEDDEQTVSMIPVLERSDLSYKTDYIETEEKSGENYRYLYQQAKTNGIGYVKLMFDLRTLPEELLPYATLLAEVIGKLPTKQHTESELSEMSGLYCGNIGQCISIYEHSVDLSSYFPVFEMYLSFLTDNAQSACGLAHEMLLDTLFDSKKRVGEVIAEARSELTNVLINSAESVALNEVRSNYSIAEKYNDKLKGRGYLKLLNALSSDYEGKAEDICAKLARTADILFAAENLTAAFIGEKEEEQKTAALIKGITDGMGAGSGKHDLDPTLNGNMGRIKGCYFPSQVNYVCAGGILPEEARVSEGTMAVATHILRSGYLWQKVRVEGGAYGCVVANRTASDIAIVSYRDPNLAETFDVYNGIANELRSFDPTPLQMDRFVVGALSNLEQPMNEKNLGEKMLIRSLSGVSKQRLLDIRQQIIETTVEDIRKAGDWIEKALSGSAKCVCGSENALNENKDLFCGIEPML